MEDEGAGFPSGYEAARTRLFEAVEDACGEGGEWPLRVRAAVASVLSLFAADPGLARHLLVAPYGAGPEVEQRHQETLDLLADLMRSGRAEVDASSMPQIVEEGLIGSVAFVLGRSIRRGDPMNILGLAPELTALLLAPYLGREEAARIAAGDSSGLP